jgi:hypothetical protein
MSSLYETDFHAWTQEMAEAIRSGRGMTEANARLIAEEIEDLGKSERNSLRSAITQLFIHLLKKQHQPKKATRSWELPIKNQQIEIEDILDENPSLKPLLKDDVFIQKTYGKARVMAAIETNSPESKFPNECPFDETVFGWPKFQTKGR